VFVGVCLKAKYGQSKQGNAANTPTLNILAKKNRNTRKTLFVLKLFFISRAHPFYYIPFDFTSFTVGTKEK
jgi:hypothetical protein